MSKYFNPKKRVNIFDKILMETPSTNLFDLSRPNKLSFNMGKLVPCFLQEVLPGDKFTISEEHMIKVAPLVFPTMHNVKVQCHYFNVPNRLLWENFEKYQAYDTLNTIPEHPYVSLYANTAADNVVEIGSMADYMGIPTGDYNAVLPSAVDKHPLNFLNALALAAPFKVFDDYFRDQNLVPEKFQMLTDGDNSLNPMFAESAPVATKLFKKGTLLSRAWEKDYFTSALPFAQKGQEVVLPLGDTANLIYDGTISDDGSIVRDAATGLPVTGAHSLTEDSGFLQTDDLPSPGSSLPSDLDITNSHLVDLSTATAASINDLRVAVRLQEFFERNARLGTRYIEQMLGKFNVRISDERAHRSEFIGVTTAPLVFSEVLQTSETAATPLAQQAGHGLSINSESAVNHYCEEHGWIVGFISVMPDTSYSQGLNRHWLKEDILDYYDPMFANLGEQAINNWEIFLNANNNTVRGTFGYQGRYSDLKYNLGEVHGEFRDQLKPFHMAREFATMPALNEDFINCDATHNIFADTDPNTDKIYAYMHHKVSARRKIPFYSTPSFSSNMT